MTDSDEDGPRPSKRPRASLFLPDSDDEREIGDNDARQPRPPQPDISAIFDDAENDETLAYVPLAPPLDLDILRREADARHAKNIEPIVPTALHQIMPSSSPPRDTGEGTNRKDSGKSGAGADDSKVAEGTKERRKIFKLDEASLLGPNGFPQLIKDTKGFRPKGKGHEVSDLNRLLQIYQFWTHRLYPKSQFRDTVERVEKLCHSKRMHVALSVWRDEARGLANGDGIDISSDEKDPDDAESAANAQETGDNTQDKTSRSSTREPSPSSSIPTRPPSSASDHVSLADDFDIDEFIREEASRTTSDAQPAPPAKVKATYGKPKGASIELAGDDEAMWDEVMVLNDPPKPPPHAPDNAKVVPADRLFDDDDEMWDVVHEMEKDPKPPPPPISSVEPAAAPTDDDDDFESMFL